MKKLALDALFVVSAILFAPTIGAQVMQLTGTPSPEWMDYWGLRVFFPLWIGNILGLAAYGQIVNPPLRLEKIIRYLAIATTAAGPFCALMAGQWHVTFLVTSAAGLVVTAISFLPTKVPEVAGTTE